MGDCIEFGVDCDVAAVGDLVKSDACAGMVLSFESGTIKGFIVLKASAPKRPRIAQRVTTREVRFILFPVRRGEKAWLSLSCIPIPSSALQYPLCASAIFYLCM